MTNIADDARDMQAMAGNDLNYTNYNFIEEIDFIHNKYLLLLYGIKRETINISFNKMKHGK